MCSSLKAYGDPRLSKVQLKRLEDGRYMVTIPSIPGCISLRPDEIMYIGDSFENDINPSRQVGMRAMI